MGGCAVEAAADWLVTGAEVVESVAVDDEAGDGVRPPPRRPLVDRVVVEPVEHPGHAGVGVPHVQLHRGNLELHSVTSSSPAPFGAARRLIVPRRPAATGTIRPT